jgi:hypothetical protein
VIHLLISQRNTPFGPIFPLAAMAMDLDQAADPGALGDDPLSFII